MTRQVTASEAKAKLLGLLEDAAGGEEIEITKHGRTLARLVPAAGARSLKGSCQGVAITADDDDDDAALYRTDSPWAAG